MGMEVQNQVARSRLDIQNWSYLNRMCRLSGKSAWCCAFGHEAFPNRPKIEPLNIITKKNMEHIGIEPQDVARLTELQRKSLQNKGHGIGRP